MNKRMLSVIAIGSLSTLCCAMFNNTNLMVQRHFRQQHKQLMQQQQQRANEQRRREQQAQYTNGTIARRYIDQGVPVPAQLFDKLDPTVYSQAIQHNQRLAQQQQK